VTKGPPTLPPGYGAWLAGIKTQIRDARLRTALAVNSELIMLYWQIGRDILSRQARDGWGTKVVDRLSVDLRVEFPEARGFSRANLLYMRAFAEAWPDPDIVQQLVGRVPWGQNIKLLGIKDSATRLWYAQATLAQGWSRAVLDMQIDTKAHARQGQALTNFSRVLLPATSDLAQQILKDPYHFDFLTVSQPLQERDVEQGLIRSMSSTPHLSNRVRRISGDTEWRRAAYAGKPRRLSRSIACQRSLC
jgi:predicted nuclease of restriction endonuclease-like (RecB) superfamily